MEITYDAWGNFTDTVSTYQGVPSTEQLQALAMPFRYRGYVYDQETELYYLNTRYYDAKMHRFINADSTSYLGANGDLVGYNLYAYCSNNPVMYSDPSGNTTVFVGLNAYACAILGVYISYSAVFDDHGNFAIQKTESDMFNNRGVIFGAVGASAGLTFGFSLADTVYDSEGIGLDVSLDVMGVSFDSDTGEFTGLSYSVGADAGSSIGVSGTVTTTIFSVNINEKIDAFKKKWNAFWGIEEEEQKSYD